MWDNNNANSNKRLRNVIRLFTETVMYNYDSLTWLWHSLEAIGRGKSLCLTSLMTSVVTWEGAKSRLAGRILPRCSLSSLEGSDSGLLWLLNVGMCWLWCVDSLTTLWLGVAAHFCHKQRQVHWSMFKTGMTHCKNFSQRKKSKKRAYSGRDQRVEEKCDILEEFCR